MKENCYFKAGNYGTKVNVVILKKDVEFQNGQFLQDIELEGKFIWTQEMLDSEIAKKTKIIFKGKSFAPRYDRTEYNPEVPRNLIDDEDRVGTTEEGGKILQAIFGKKVFDYPKVPSLIEYLINFLCDKDSIILDSFAGSGTTAHAVLNLNKQDGGNRKFILVEMEDYAENITAERVRRVINGYGKDKNAVKGTGGGFAYYELGEPVFAGDNLNENIGVQKLREYIWYSETRTPYTSQALNSYLLGCHDSTDYYFYYEPDRITTLSHDTLNIVERTAEAYVIYADRCTIDKEWLNNHHIVFKKIPRDIRRF